MNSPWAITFRFCFVQPSKMVPPEGVLRREHIFCFSYISWSLNLFIGFMVMNGVLFMESSLMLKFYTKNVVQFRQRKFISFYSSIFCIYSLYFYCFWGLIIPFSLSTIIVARVKMSCHLDVPSKKDISFEINLSRGKH